MTHDLAAVVWGGENVTGNWPVPFAVNSLPYSQFGITWEYDFAGSTLQSKNSTACVLVGLGLRIEIPKKVRKHDFHADSIGRRLAIHWIDIPRTVSTLNPSGAWGVALAHCLIQSSEDPLLLQISCGDILQDADKIDLFAILRKDCRHAPRMVNVIVGQDERGNAFGIQVISQEFEQNMGRSTAIDDNDAAVSEVNYMGAGLPHIQKEALGSDHNLFARFLFAGKPKW